MLTQDDYKLYTGETSTLSPEDWSKMVSIAATRLAMALCLDELPMVDGNLPDDLAMLLANFICLMLAHQGKDSQVTSKRVRNFSISFGSNSSAGAFSKLLENYVDIINKYSACGNGMSIEHNTRTCCGRF